MASVDGLVTGMNTTDTIAQLMQVEAAPQAALKTKITTANKVVTAYQSVNTRMLSIAAAAKALGDPDSWGSQKATVSSDAAVVSTRAGSSPGALSFRVEQLATTHVETFTGGSVANVTTAPAVATTTFDVVMPAKAGNSAYTKQLTPRDQSLQSVIAAINGEEDLPYKAAAVLVGPGMYTLQLTAKQSGTTGEAAFKAVGPPTGLDLGGPPADMVTAVDAKLSVDGPLGAFDVFSNSNTFADVMPGVTITAAKVQTDTAVTVDLVPDGEGVAAKVQAMIDNVNVALSEIAAQSKIKSGDLAAGALVGDSAMRKLTQDILSTVSSGAAKLGGNGSTGSFKEVGITVGQGGQLKFEKKDFIKAYTGDPVKVQEFFDRYEDSNGVTTAATFDPGLHKSVGLARKLETVAAIATTGVTDPANPLKAPEGVLKGLMNRRTENIRGLNDQVTQWDIRLELRKTALQKQFSSLEVALGKMKQQSSWLASQLAGLG